MEKELIKIINDEFNEIIQLRINIGDGFKLEIIVKKIIKLINDLEENTQNPELAKICDQSLENLQNRKKREINNAIYAYEKATKDKATLKCKNDYHNKLDLVIKGVKLDIFPIINYIENI
jgi:hypothetical protein